MDQRLEYFRRKKKKKNLHDDIFRLPHILNDQISNVFHLMFLNIVIVGDYARNVENAEMRSIRSGDFNFENFGGKILLVFTNAWVNSQILGRHLSGVTGCSGNNGLVCRLTSSTISLNSSIFSDVLILTKSR